jgi:hypothetical protein
VVPITNTKSIFKTICETSFSTSESAIFLVSMLAGSSSGYGYPTIAGHLSLSPPNGLGPWAWCFWRVYFKEPEGNLLHRALLSIKRSEKYVLGVKLFQFKFKEDSEF